MLHEWQEYDYAQTRNPSLYNKVWIKTLEFLDHAHRTLKYGCLYLLLGWLGLFLLWYHNKRFEAGLLIIIALSGATKIFSHLESRYLIPHYAFFCFALGICI